MDVYELSIVEILYFFNPEEKSHEHFSKVADLEMLMFPRERQVGQTAINIQLGATIFSVSLNNLLDLTFLPYLFHFEFHTFQCLFLGNC